MREEEMSNGGSYDYWKQEYHSFREILQTTKHNVEYKEKALQGLVHVWFMTLEKVSAEDEENMNTFMTSLLSECTKRFTYEELLSKPGQQNKDRQLNFYKYLLGISDNEKPL